MYIAPSLCWRRGESAELSLLFPESFVSSRSVLSCKEQHTAVVALLLSLWCRMINDHKSLSRRSTALPVVRMHGLTYVTVLSRPGFSTTRILYSLPVSKNLLSRKPQQDHSAVLLYNICILPAVGMQGRDRNCSTVQTRAVLTCRHLQRSWPRLTFLAAGLPRLEHVG